MALDIQIFYFLNSLAGQSLLLDRVIVFCASYLAYILGTVFILWIIFSRSDREEKRELVLVAGLSALIARLGVTELIRFFYHHPRPFAALPDVHQLLSDSAWSFPSGHATFFFALSTGVYLYNRRLGAAFYLVTLAITLARVAAGVHYPSDIVGGAVIGIATAGLIYKVFHRSGAPEMN